MDGADEEFSWPPRGTETGKRDSGQGALRRPRWIVSLRAVIVVLAMMAAALGVLWLEAAGVSGVSAEHATEEMGKVAVPPLGTATDQLAPSAAANPRESQLPSGMLLVHVAGAVKNPGVFPLASGSRVYQAIAAAGGALPDAQLAALNLAATVSDGQQILVPARGEMVAAPPSAAPGAASGPININTATAAELDALPGVGPVLADRIVAWRTEHGPYPSVDALDAVSGIGTKMLENIRALVRVS